MQNYDRRLVIESEGNTFRFAKLNWKNVSLCMKNVHKRDCFHVLGLAAKSCTESDMFAANKDGRNKNVDLLSNSFSVRSELVTSSRKNLVLLFHITRQLRAL